LTRQIVGFLQFRIASTIPLKRSMYAPYSWAAGVVFRVSFVFPPVQKALSPAPVKDHGHDRPVEGGVS